jgi:hypothetical protein
MILDDNDGLTKPSNNGRPSILNHLDMEQYLGRYAGLMLYLKEMDEGVYAKLCAVRARNGSPNPFPVTYCYSAGILLCR